MRNVKAVRRMMNEREKDKQQELAAEKRRIDIINKEKNMENEWRKNRGYGNDVNQLKNNDKQINKRQKEQMMIKRKLQLKIDSNEKYLNNMKNQLKEELI